MLMKSPDIGHNSSQSVGNWIAADRDLRYHEIVGFLKADGSVRKGVIVCQTMAWLDLIMEANWKDRRENNNGKVVLVERGQLIGARAWLAKRWGWTENKVRWFLKKLEDNDMIARSSPKITQQPHTNRNQSNNQPRAHYANVITICNYDIYQTAYEIDDLLRDQSNNQSTTNQQPHHNKGTREQEESPPYSPPKGKAPKKASPKKTRLPEDWTLPDEWREWARDKRGLTDGQIDFLAENFHRYWTGPDAKNPMKADWKRTWQNGVDMRMKPGRPAIPDLGEISGAGAERKPPDVPEHVWQAMLAEKRQKNGGLL
jgi:hypothetical protein